VAAAVPRPSPTQVHVNPNFLMKKGGSGGGSSALEELKKKEMELQMLKKQKEELALRIKQQEIDRELEEARQEVERQKALIMNVGQPAVTAPTVSVGGGSGSPLSSTNKLATAASTVTSSKKPVISSKKVRCEKSIYCIIQKFKILSSTSSTPFQNPSKKSVINVATAA